MSSYGCKEGLYVYGNAVKITASPDNFSPDDPRLSLCEVEVYSFTYGKSHSYNLFTKYKKNLGKTNAYNKSFFDFDNFTVNDNFMIYDTFTVTLTLMIHAAEWVTLAI